MAPFLIVSDPPHVEPDPEPSARCLGVTVAEARMKANFPAPEVWQAFADESEAASAAESLAAAGLRTAIIDGAHLVELPPQLPAVSFAFDDGGLAVTLRDGAVGLPYDAAVTGVFCKTPKGFAAPEPVLRRSANPLALPGRKPQLARLVGSGAPEGRGTSVADALERAVFLDLYVKADGAPVRVTIPQDLADFSGLGELKQLTAADNMAMCVRECERRFSRLHMDRRLEDVRPRGRLRVGVAPQEGRKLLSFGTVALSELLESISEDLGDITQFELGSRLAYLMARRS